MILAFLYSCIILRESQKLKAFLQPNLKFGQGPVFHLSVELEQSEDIEPVTSRTVEDLI